MINYLSNLNRIGGKIMSDKRTQDTKISMRNHNGVTIIGTTGGDSYIELQENFQQWTEDCAKLVTPCSHTHKETVEYFLEQCDALPIAIDDKRMKYFQLTIVANFYKHKLKHQPPDFSLDMTDEEIEKMHQQDDAMRDEVLNTSPEDFGLNILGYYLPHTKRNEAFYEQAYLEAQESIKSRNNQHINIKMQDICFFFEETTGQFQANGGAMDLMDKLIIFRGVSGEDIEQRNVHFQSYISVLRDMGHLPNFMEK
jgi:hypothetical protein